MTVVVYTLSASGKRVLAALLSRHPSLHVGWAPQQVDSEQGQPAKADDDCDALKQPGETHETLCLAKSRAGEDEREREGEAAEDRVDRPSALAPRGESAAKHEAGRRQCYEGGEREKVVEGAVPAVPGQSVGGSGRVAAHGVGDEDPRA
jgi:hypothetical protein